ncbi:YfcE family phosphodiesterase [Lacticaseibacillus jixiensis]|uniref:YfcE family phosphodiesterase n=1 Tax=Lacticaseibacillus jixiensis TaxID=3231926 RepID=UPI0036F3C8A2
MQIVVVSDTHGDRTILEQILTYAPEAAAYFYCGDSELPASDPLWQTYHVVAGNMDFDSDYPLTDTEVLASVTVFMTHGHRFNVNFTLDPLIAAAQAAKADIALFGHTHQLGVEMHDGILVLNPGSIAQPRGEFANLHGTYALIDITPTAFTVTYHTRDGQTVAKLTRRFSR